MTILKTQVMVHRQDIMIHYLFKRCRRSDQQKKVYNCLFATVQNLSSWLLRSQTFMTKQGLLNFQTALALMNIWQQSLANFSKLRHQF